MHIMGMLTLHVSHQENNVVVIRTYLNFTQHDHIHQRMEFQSHLVGHLIQVHSFHLHQNGRIIFFALLEIHMPLTSLSQF